MPTASLISGLVEHSINYWLRQTGVQQNVPKPLLGKQFVIKITDLKLELQMHVQQGADDYQGLVSVWSPANDQADCTISCTLSGLYQLQQPAQITKLIKQGELDIEGDVQLAQTYADWLKSSLVHWQDVLASVTSGPVAHKISEAGQQTFELAQKQLANQQRALVNIVWDEKKLAPHPIEVADFTEQVKQLRQDTDRFEARLQQLIQKVEQL
ncbi:ubiquinone biosynthesis accessory factor UbiJ [Catenovulum agarivorans]|uniref:ubiquinone biosynthesis accessory factor UbiJ n=1 Tax=Catenovulum agarivorans TaxID=1172192 RepID=UPI0003096AD8|nr:SCP2 sterol-binding domain-containing protein [Catenovulum agarivorans]